MHGSRLNNRPSEEQSSAVLLGRQQQRSASLVISSSSGTEQGSVQQQVPVISRAVSYQQQQSAMTTSVGPGKMQPFQPQEGCVHQSTTGQPHQQHFATTYYRSPNQQSPHQAHQIMQSQYNAAGHYSMAHSQTQNYQQQQQNPPKHFLRRSHHHRFFDNTQISLSEAIWLYHKQVEQTEATLNRKLQLRDLLYYTICPIFPMCGLYVVGSSLNGFGTNTSDMDLCLIITNKDLDQKTDAIVVLNMVLAALTGVEFVASQQLIAAKVPILRLKFTAPFEDITVDLNANNSVAIKNTHLLCYYSSYDWRVRPLVTVVKEWARRKGINEANRSSFTSYSLVLMVIHYLQCGCRPPVLPSLQRCYPEWFKPQCDVRTLNVTKTLPAPDKYVFRFENHMSLGELLVGFLDYYANRFDYNKDAISVRWGKRLDRVAVVAKKSPYSVSRSPNDTPISLNGNDISQQWIAQWRCICIEEPFTRQNTAHSIYNEMIFEEIKRAFREAHTELEATRDLDAWLANAHPISTTYPPYNMA